MICNKIRWSCSIKIIKVTRIAPITKLNCPCILVYFVLIYIRDYKDLKRELKSLRGGIDGNE